MCGHKCQLHRVYTNITSIPVFCTCVPSYICTEMIVKLLKLVRPVLKYNFVVGYGIVGMNQWLLIVAFIF